MSVIFDTPGLLDIRAFTTFGLHAKPNTTNPIGRFGSGLKNAVAVLVREGARVVVFIGETEYEFYCSKTSFRDSEFDLIRMKKRSGFMSKWRYYELPYTTAHAKHWEMWQAFRELHSNTIDEGGVTHCVDEPVEDTSIRPDRTMIVVEDPKFDREYHERDKTFLPGALTHKEGDDRVQVFSEPSNYIYWRGLRVFDLEKPSMYTYNILEDITLTEDRTIKYLWDVQSKLAAYVARSKDRKMIRAVVGASPEKFFEGRLDFDYAYVSPSEAFKEVVAKRKLRGTYVAPRALAFYDRYSPPPPRNETLRDRVSKWAYDSDLPQELRDLLQHLLKCEIKEPDPVDDNSIPF